MIICFTTTGRTARHVSKYRPSASIIVVGIDDQVIRGLQMCRGITCMKANDFKNKELLEE